MAKKKAARGRGSRAGAKTGPKKTARAAQKARAAGKRTSRRRAGAAGAKKAAKKTSAARKVVAKKAARPAARKTARKAPPARATARKTAKPRRAPTLDRARRTVAESEMVPTPPSSLNMDRSASAARSGRAELADALREHTSTSPAMTAGDVDADWESAEAVGDEAPGGDNPTPDQDVVDDIGRALGIEYDDDEELKGGDELIERDKKRWELDPASSDDYEDRD